MTRWRLLTVGLAMAATAGACTTAPPPAAPPPAPAYPDYARPVVPSGVSATPETRERHDAAWRQLQADQPSSAAAAFEAIVEATPGFYPARAGLGYARLATRDLSAAAEQFEAAVEADDDYLPAWLGLMRARLARGDDAGAIVAIRRVIELDPARTDLQGQLDLLTFRRVQALIAEGRAAHAANRLPEALDAFERALELSPTSGGLHREIAAVELETGAIESAEAHARRAIALDPNVADYHAMLAEALEAQGRDRDAIAAWAEAIRIDPRPEWRTHAASLETRTALGVIPEEYRAVPTAETVTRAQVAAFIGIRLEDLIARSPGEVTEIATDVSGHWAAPWILPVTRAGVMDLFPNHTFQPGEPVRRGDLARIVAGLLELNPQRRMDLMRWQALRPEFADLPETNLFYAAAALAVSAGAMSADGGRFRATAPASGPELVAAIARIEEIAGR